MNTLASFEYVDREHYSTVCVGQFEVRRPGELPWSVGDQFICPATEQYGGYLDGKTLLPILLTVLAVTNAGMHLCFSKRGAQLAEDLCLRLNTGGTQS